MRLRKRQRCPPPLPTSFFFFSCAGPGDADDESNPNRGLLPRCIEHIFAEASASAAAAAGGEGGGATDGSAATVFKASYLEIYNERIFDLCAPAGVAAEGAPGAASLSLRESAARGVYVEGLTETPVASAAQARALLALGAKNRRVSATAMNHESSRSHSVFTLSMETAERTQGGAAMRARAASFHLIDLAGSERQKSACTSGERLKEASQINKSLSALAGVIGALVDIAAGKARHVHYRDSKLTHLLRDSLGGNARTSIVATVHPSDDCYPETLATLKFAETAKLVTNRAVINENTTGTVCQLQAEIRALRGELSEYKCA